MPTPDPVAVLLARLMRLGIALEAHGDRVRPATVGHD